jgi:phage terminase large subunit-like protein
MRWGSLRARSASLKHNGRWGNLTAPRAFRRFLLLAGRGGGKTLVGAHAVREELMIPARCGGSWRELQAAVGFDVPDPVSGCCIRSG